jgi:hypothetical protein
MQMEKLKSAPTVSQNGSKDPVGIAALHAPAVFKALLRHERSRSSRDGSEFSLAVFNVTSILSSSRSMKQIIRGIQERMRSIDEIGWLDPQSIGVLLPATNLHGGRKFANRVSESVTIAQGSVPWTIYAYPSHWVSGGNGDSEDEFVHPARPGKNGNGSAHSGEETRFSTPLSHAFSLRVPAWKRCIDVVGSIVLIVLSSPLLLLLPSISRSHHRGKCSFDRSAWDTREGFSHSSSSARCMRITTRARIEITSSS